jgi:hypothetical protein
MTAGHAIDRAAAPSSAQPLDRSDFTSLKLVPSQPQASNGNGPNPTLTILVTPAFEKGNLSSAKRPLTFAALLPQTCGILPKCGAIIGFYRFRAGEPRIYAHMIAASRP